jgi:hypothetical protein
MGKGFDTIGLDMHLKKLCLNCARGTCHGLVSAIWGQRGCHSSPESNRKYGCTDLEQYVERKIRFLETLSWLDLDRDFRGRQRIVERTRERNGLCSAGIGSAPPPLPRLSPQTLVNNHPNQPVILTQYLVLAGDLHPTSRFPNMASRSMVLIGMLSALGPPLADRRGPMPTRESEDPMLHGTPS